jgi:hypothetical protein
MLLQRYKSNVNFKKMFVGSCILEQFFYKINQQDATVFQVYCFTFICGPTCSGRHTAHHQENTTAPVASGFA